MDSKAPVLPEVDVLSQEDKRALSKEVNPALRQLMVFPGLIVEIHFAPKSSTVNAVIRYLESKEKKQKEEGGGLAFSFNCSTRFVDNKEIEVKIKVSRTG
jgi:hypothetical protein